MINFGREITAHEEATTNREWLVTNGIGGLAYGTLSGAITRRYHGLLVAALEPPLGRILLVSNVDETVVYDGQDYNLFANQWRREDTPFKPKGYQYIERFYLEGTMPVWVYAVGDALLEKRIWMQYGENTTYVRYKLLRGSLPIELYAKVLANYTDFHVNMRADDWQMRSVGVEHGLGVVAYDDAVPFYLLSDRAAVVPYHEWHRDYYLKQEAYRGLDALANHLHIAQFEVTLLPGEAVTLVFSTHGNVNLDGEAALVAFRQRETMLIGQSLVHDSPDWVQQLVLAADQFIVQRGDLDGQPGRSVIAGYPWFSDWGRDTMISLPGLALVTGRFAEAAQVLRTYARYVDEGMLPNRFPDKDAAQSPEYNTADATLWYFEAVHAYYAATHDIELVRELFPILQDILAWHQRGTRYGIGVDMEDGLLFSGEAGVQLTWMDVKINNWVVTPRHGKAVEINALWYNALRSMAEFAGLLDADPSAYEGLADRVQSSFVRFWNPERGYLFDVIDTPQGDDATLRPNQLIAVSLKHVPLSEEKARAIVDVCARQLLTSMGLRSLGPHEAAYAGVFKGGPQERDAVYHQGTVWAWLIGPFVAAHLRVYGDVDLARSFLVPFAEHLADFGLGTISEVAWGNVPHTPRGCIAQAWSVAEVLRAWNLTGS